jgi:ribonuclease BN (tRNA processing enzyme)
MSVEVVFLGTGSASAPAGRSHACVLVRDGTTAFLLDCGSSAPPAITRAIDPGRIDAVLVSHLHGDHFGGIPYLLMEQSYAGRTRPLVLAGPRDLERRVRELAVALYTDFYAHPVPYDVPFITLGPSEHDIFGVRVAALPVVHLPGSDAHGLRVRIGEKLIAYSGDAEWSDAIPALADGADLFICESTTYALRWPGHLSALELATHRDELRCSRIVLTHLAPEAVAHHDDIPFEIAYDGMSVLLA